MNFPEDKTSNDFVDWHCMYCMYVRLLLACLSARLAVHLKWTVAIAVHTIRLTRCWYACIAPVIFTLYQRVHVDRKANEWETEREREREMFFFYFLLYYCLLWLTMKKHGNGYKTINQMRHTIKYTTTTLTAKHIFFLTFNCKISIWICMQRCRFGLSVCLSVCISICHFIYFLPYSMLYSSSSSR